MAAPYAQPAQPAGHNAPPWRPPPSAGPTGKSSAAIPPADMLLPYVDQSTLNALANLGKFIEFGDLHPDALAPNSTQATKTQVAFDPDNRGVATFTTEVKRKTIDDFDTTTSINNSQPASSTTSPMVPTSAPVETKHRATPATPVSNDQPGYRLHRNNKRTAPGPHNWPIRRATSAMGWQENGKRMYPILVAVQFGDTASAVVPPQPPPKPAYLAGS
ncbi:uncharacterized protein [Ptychodera flava]|uniref:uncharacterized protein n=1 Tax=Ptychodera flava TaxID=63121 RepID=UPI00396A8FE9